MSATALSDDDQGLALQLERSPASPDSLQCPSCGSSNVAQVLGDNGGVSYVCTACGHIWS
ncbi:hypothetical protein [Streptomyces iconiensis]|uniref:Transcription factor zinc-finger domain-containing protein n=1 Tax=Streptomyces iconiensis TaxID=1384038 RepID=A0ABT6ZMW5_9ACTN|nr:hypothetical protein [Streptomyces iconiensis]MDJ1130400.1 hypothetical protein [Streptomyces iconiensis]